MVTPSAQLRAAFAGKVPDNRAEEFLSWLAEREALIHAISGGSLLSLADPGWVDLWEQEASLDECLEDLASVDFEFEGMLLAHNGESP
jgi:hypothetical protein